MDCYTSRTFITYTSRSQSALKKKSKMGWLMQRAIIYAGIHPFTIYAPTSLVCSTECAEECFQGVFYSTWPALCNQLNAAVYIYVPQLLAVPSSPANGIKEKRAPDLICDTLHLSPVGVFLRLYYHSVGECWDLFAGRDANTKIQSRDTNKFLFLFIEGLFIQ